MSGIFKVRMRREKSERGSRASEKTLLPAPGTGPDVNPL
jgi:hypothetical protein